MANTEQKIVKIVDTTNPTVEGSVIQQGSRGAQVVALVDSSGSPIIGADGAIPVKDGKATTAGASSGVSVGSSSTTVLASNVDRKQAIFVNDSDEVIYLKYGSGATLNSGIRVNPYGGTVIETVYTGIVTGICSSGSKNITVTEL